MHGIVVVELGGEKRTLALNMHFLMFLSKTLKCNPDEIREKVLEACEVNQLRGLTFIIYCGILGYLETEAIYEHDITLKQVSKWVGEANLNEFTSVWEAFSEIMEVPKATQEQIDEYVKKYEDKLKKKPEKKA
jgi:hypothetical protein